MKRSMLIVQQVSLRADAFYDHGQKFGQWAAQTGMRRAQITELENVANSSLKVSDILDYLKKQTAKSKNGREWRQHLTTPQEAGTETDANPVQQQLGPEMITFISDRLRRERDVVCNGVGSVTQQLASEQEKQQVYLALIREFVRQV